MTTEAVADIAQKALYLIIKVSLPVLLIIKLGSRTDSGMESFWNSFNIIYNDGNGEINGALRIFLTLTLIALAPTIIIMMTSFTRIIIVLCENR